MIKFKLNNNVLDSFKDFLKLKEFNEYNPDSKSVYWQHHSKLVKFFIKNDYIYIQGDSGFYLPDKKFSLKTFWRFIKYTISSVINFSNPYFPSWFINKKVKKAFEYSVNGDTSSKIKFNKEKIFTNNISYLKKIFPWKEYLINFHIVKTYYWLNILASYSDIKKKEFIVEIGGGNGNFISLLKHHCKNKCIIDIDLPETLVHCIAYIQSVFPTAKILFPHEVSKKITKQVLDKYDFIFLTTSQIEHLDDNTIDVFINTGSFCEMNKKQIKDYFELVQRASKKDSLLLNVNRAEKVPVAGRDNEISKLPPINKFVEYPFFKDNEVLIFEICQFFEKLVKDKVYVRLEKIKK